MIREEEVQTILRNSGNVIGEDGAKIGSVGQIFLDDETSEPEWVTVKTGLFGGSESFVPLQRASVEGNDVRVPFDKSKVKDAPRVDADTHLSKEEEAELYRYYGMEYTEARSDSGTAGGMAGGMAGGQTDRTDTDRMDTGRTDAGYSDRDDAALTDDQQRGVGRDTSGPNTDDAMTRSEERVDIGTERVSTGRARLRKYVVTENVTKTVPVEREEVRIEREPITDANRGDAVSGGDLTSEEHEVELSEERVVVDKDVEPVERVRLDKETVTDEQQVNEEVRKEQIDTEGVDDSGRQNPR